MRHILDKMQKFETTYSTLILFLETIMDCHSFQIRPPFDPSKFASKEKHTHSRRAFIHGCLWRSVSDSPKISILNLHTDKPCLSFTVPGWKIRLLWWDTLHWSH